MAIAARSRSSSSTRPLDADQGFIQKIFYLHVPLAIMRAGRLRRRRRLRDPAPAHAATARWDARSYVSIHMSVIFGVAVLITGAIWAKASWGHWWVWDEPTLVSFLIVFLLYATYYPLPLRDRGSRAPGPLRLGLRDHRRRLRAAQLHGGAAGRALVHPRVFATTDGGLPGSMMFDLPRLPRRRWRCSG